MANTDVQPILEIEDLNISFFVRAGEIPAVMDFSCKVMPGETMGLVGESGCGKSTVALGIMRICDVDHSQEAQKQCKKHIFEDDV